MKTITNTTIDLNALENTSNGEIIIDGGATATVAGLIQYSTYCDIMGL